MCRHRKTQGTKAKQYVVLRTIKVLTGNGSSKQIINIYIYIYIYCAVFENFENPDHLISKINKLYHYKLKGIACLT